MLHFVESQTYMHSANQSVSMVKFRHNMISEFRPFASVSKQLICRELFLIESQKFQIKSQIKLRSFESHRYSSNRISKSAQIAI